MMDNNAGALPAEMNIERDLIAILHAQLNVEVPSAETELLASGLLDSLKFVDLLVSIEQRFGTKIPLEQLELDDFRSVRQIAAFLQRASLDRTSELDRAA